jgi:hypothetical protein
MLSCGSAPIDAVALAPGSVARGLVAHWSLDEGAGTAVLDRSGNGHAGTLSGGSWVPRGRFGGALTLAPGDSVTVHEFPQATPSWTVSLWTYLTAADLGGQNETLLSTENVFAGGWQLHLDDRPGYARFDAAYWVGDPVDDYVVLFCDCIETDTWIHLTAVFDGAAGRFSLHRDGVEVDRADMPNTILPGDSTLYFGKWNMNERLFSGLLDDVAIWSRALSPEEIQLITTRPVPAPE